MTPSLSFSIPEPCLDVVENLTPFAVFQCDKMGVGRVFHDTVVVKGTFALAPGKLRVARLQAPIVLADDYWDRSAAERSSVKSAGEVVLVKPGTDVLVTGTVRSPGGRAVREWDVAVVVKDPDSTVLEHRARVNGPRKWRYTSLRGWTLTDPEPAAEVPIRYELACGGAYPDKRYSPAADGRRKWIVHRPNPSGTGFFDERALDPGKDHLGPQWQAPGRPALAMNVDAPLSGLGPVARHWSARTKWGGTYDAAWLARTRAEVQRGLPADYPADFDPRFFQCAHPDLITKRHLLGDEIVALGGMAHEHDWLAFQLPGIEMTARLLDDGGTWLRQEMPLDTVHVDLDAGAVYLCWRLTLAQARRVRAAVIFTTEAE